MVTLLYLGGPLTCPCIFQGCGVLPDTESQVSGYQCVVCEGTGARVCLQLSVSVTDRQRERMTMREKRRGTLQTEAQTAFGVLLEGHPFSVRVYLPHILFISVCSDWDSGAFKQLRHVSLMKQEKLQVVAIADLVSNKRKHNYLAEFTVTNLQGSHGHRRPTEHDFCKTCNKQTKPTHTSARPPPTVVPE